MAVVESIINLFIAVLVLSTIVGVVLLIGVFVVVSKLPDDIDWSQYETIKNADGSMTVVLRNKTGGVVPIPPPPPPITVDPAPTEEEQADEAAEGAASEPFTVRYRSSISPFVNGRYVSAEREQYQKVIY